MPHGAPEVVTYGILFVFSVGLLVHWLRRGFRHPVPTELGGDKVSGSVIAFDLVQRVFHWLTTASFVGIVVTGVALYDPFGFEPITDALGVPLHGSFESYVFTHVAFSVLLGVLLAIHVAWDVRRLKASENMRLRSEDVRDALTRVKNFVFVTKEYPRMGKYDAFMKTFHYLLIACFVALAVTGLYQYFFAPWWLYIFDAHFEIEPFWRPTIIHDLFGFLLMALVISHTYFSILPVNHPLLRSMVKGSLSEEEIKRRYKPDTPPRRT